MLEKLPNSGCVSDPATTIETQREALRLENGEAIDAGIEDLVVMLNVYGIRTIQSCAGHLEAEDRDSTLAPSDIKYLEGRYICGPYINFVIADNEKRQFPSEIGKEKDYYRLCLEVQQQMLGCLNEFYRERDVPADVRLCFWGDGSYTLANQGAFLLESINFIDREVRQAKLVAYQAEMSAFAVFLREKFIAAG